MTQVAPLDARWQLYRLLSDPFRLRLLALAAEEELALGGRALCEKDGSLARIVTIVRARDQKTREFFARPPRADEPLVLAPELPVYIAALASLLDAHGLAVDAGTGDGALLDVLAPAFDRVVALDRSAAQLARAERRVQARGYDNVELCSARR